MLSLLLATSMVAASPPLCDGDETLIGKNVPTHATYCNTGLPPERYKDKDSIVLIQFLRPIKVDEYCKHGQPLNGTVFACTEPLENGMFGLTMPNPCEYAQEPGEYYAILLCHELGHVAGWPNYHGD